MTDITNSANMKGFYEFYKNDELVGSTQNTLTNGFLSRFLNAQTRTNYTRCYCGSGTTPTDPTDVGMESFIAGSETAYKNYTNITRYIDDVDSKYKIMYTYVFTYNAGTFTGSVGEIGMKFNTNTATNSGAVVDSHTLVTDTDGISAPIPIGAGDTLTVIARFVTTLPTTGTGVIRTDGVNSTVTWELSNFNEWFGMLERGPMIENTGYCSMLCSSTQELFNDPEGDTYPSSSSTISNTYTWEFTTVGSDYVDFTLVVGVPEARVNAGIKYMQFHNDGIAAFRIRWGVHFNPPVMAQIARTYPIAMRWSFTIN